MSCKNKNTDRMPILNAAKFRRPALLTKHCMIGLRWWRKWPETTQVEDADFCNRNVCQGLSLSRLSSLLLVGKRLRKGLEGWHRAGGKDRNGTSVAQTSAFLNTPHCFVLNIITDKLCSASNYFCRNHTASFFFLFFLFFFIILHLHLHHRQQHWIKPLPFLHWIHSSTRAPTLTTLPGSAPLHLFTPTLEIIPPYPKYGFSHSHTTSFDLRRVAFVCKRSRHIHDNPIPGPHLLHHVCIRWPLPAHGSRNRRGLQNFNRRHSKPVRQTT